MPHDPSRPLLPPKVIRFFPGQWPVNGANPRLCSLAALAPKTWFLVLMLPTMIRVSRGLTKTLHKDRRVRQDTRVIRRDRVGWRWRRVRQAIDARWGRVLGFAILLWAGTQKKSIV